MLNRTVKTNVKAKGAKSVRVFTLVEMV
jgi:hypothetical protein